MTSYNPTDVAARYCGNCHQFHDDMPSPPSGVVPESLSLRSLGDGETETR